MLRRQLLATACLSPFAALSCAEPRGIGRDLFERILAGYRRNLAATSPSLAVVEYPGATVTKSFLAKSGLSATGVTRMLPALAAWIAGGHADAALIEEVTTTLRNAADPACADYWIASSATHQEQRQVESSIVAWSLWLLRDTVLPKLTSRQRRYWNDWLESCARVPVRKNNWAWFTAVNIAARRALHARFAEFDGDERFMLDDIAALDAMAVGDSGWYDDAPGHGAFDYYNSWVFASHFLYWNELVGAAYPELRARFAARLRKYLDTAPLFFGAHGGHVLYGRSLAYRFAILTPLVLAYRQGLWPHAPGLLRTIVERNLAFHDALGGYDARAGKLLESYTPTGTRAIRESYIDGGHPYWGMQAFAYWTLDAHDAFWTAPREPLPVERADFVHRFDVAGLVVRGTRATGEVRLYNVRTTKNEDVYADKYDKLVYSSHLPMCIASEPGARTPDNALLLRETATGRVAGRGETRERELRADGVAYAYTLQLGATRVDVKTDIRFTAQGGELRRHRIEATGPLDGFELIEGGGAMSVPPIRALGAVDAPARIVEGWTSVKRERLDNVSTVSRTVELWTLRAPLQARLTLVSEHTRGAL